jgi:acyl-coenzyme A synthetase/AMP-(fatty) acid ligase
MTFLYYSGNKVSYSELENELMQENYGRKIIYEQSVYRIFFWIIHSMYNEYPIVLLDGSLSEDDCLELGCNVSEDNKFPVSSRFSCYNEFYRNLINKQISWSLTLFTSGTTGRPKSVTHSIETLSRTTRMGAKYSEDSWAFAYNPTHIAGIQVFLQAFFNFNPIYYLFDQEIERFTEVVNKFKVTRVSATPTYYKNVIIADQSPCESIISATSGGEKLSEILMDQLKMKFPKAKIHNIYATTEFGSLFQATGDLFEIPEQLQSLIRINAKKELLVHRSFLGQSSLFVLEDGWYNTGDIVQIIDANHIKFVSRTSSFINVGGYKVNPIEVENKLEQLYFVKDSRVYGIPNSVTQNIIAADIVLVEDVKNSEKELGSAIKKELRKTLPIYAIPRFFNFVDNIQYTRTGKKIRK